MMIIKMIILDTYPVNNCMYFCKGTCNLFYCIPHVFSLISTLYAAVYMWPKIGNLKMCLLCSTRAKLIYLRSDLFRFYTKQVIPWKPLIQKIEVCYDFILIFSIRKCVHFPTYEWLCLYFWLSFFCSFWIWK